MHSNRIKTCFLTLRYILLINTFPVLTFDMLHFCFFSPRRKKFDLDFYQIANDYIYCMETFHTIFRNFDEKSYITVTNIMVLLASHSIAVNQIRFNILEEKHHLGKQRKHESQTGRKPNVKPGRFVRFCFHSAVFLISFYINCIIQSIYEPSHVGNHESLLCLKYYTEH